MHGLAWLLIAIFVFTLLLCVVSVVYYKRAEKDSQNNAVSTDDSTITHNNKLIKLITYDEAIANTKYYGSLAKDFTETSRHLTLASQWATIALALEPWVEPPTNED